MSPDRDGHHAGVVVTGALVLSLCLLAGAGNPSACLVPPVDAPVVDPFREPACTWCPGNRGIEYRTVPGQPVVAAAPGTVTFAGTVAGVRYVVVRHADGVSATYGGLRTATVSTGLWVATRAQVGTASERLHFGLRRAGRYLDPGPLLGEPWRRPVLVPLDGRPGRAPPARRCPAVARLPQGVVGQGSAGSVVRW